VESCSQFDRQVHKEAQMIFVVASLLLTLVQAGPANVKGTWEGTLTGVGDDGSPKDEPALLILDQKEVTVTGTVGGSQDDQFPITSGTVEGNKLTLVAKKEDGREFRVELTLENDQLKGTVASGQRTMKLQVRKRKE
jgi:hypothetical protein